MELSLCHGGYFYGTRVIYKTRVSQTRVQKSGTFLNISKKKMVDY